MDLATVETTLKDKIRNIPDWPVKGVMFRDITTLLKDAEAFNLAIEALEEKLKGLDFDVITAIESRGFIFGSVIANRMKKAFVPIRKPKKLPYKFVSRTYSLEYGTDTLAMHEDAIEKGQKVILIDDLIATGGSAKAVVEMVEELGGKMQTCLFLIELTFLNGKDQLKNCDVRSVIKY